jgi:hypothetical protein
MTAFEPTDRSAARRDSPLERYVRQLLRDADRTRRSTQPKIRSDRVVQGHRSPLKPVLRPPRGSLTDDPPPRATDYLPPTAR